MTATKIDAGKYLAQCRVCGQWREVRAEPAGTELFFAYLEADFQCCGVRQSARFTVEKDEIDFH